MTNADITYNDLKAQNDQLGEQSVGKFLRETKDGLGFFDGFRWNAIQSKAHLEQMDRALGVYLDKQLEHIEYTLALTMSKRRGELFEVYQKAVSSISERIRDQTIAYREKTTKRVNPAGLKFFEDEDGFNSEVAASSIPAARKKLLTQMNADATLANVNAIYAEMATELDHYNQMCVNIYVGMTKEIEDHRIIDVTPN